MAVTLPKLVVVADIDAAGSEARWLEVLRSLAHRLRRRPDVMIQVRAKGRPPNELERLASVAAATVDARLRLLLNGPPNLAAALGYEGVHWPEASLPPTIPPAAESLLRSASVHSLEAAQRAAPHVHFVIFGPVFTPGSKVAPAVGLTALRHICREAPVPVLAIGGIHPENARECIRAGANGIAVVSAVVGAADPADAAERLLRSLSDAPPP